MKAIARHSLVHASLTAGMAVMEKSASASPAQKQVLATVWPSEDENITKKAKLSRVIASGILVEEADISLAKAHADQAQASA